MTNSTILQAKEIQQLAGRFLYEEAAKPYTDVEEWKEVQGHLATCIEDLLKQEGGTPEEEGEIVLAILMGYSIAVRKRKNIAVAMERANRVLPLLQDAVLKCRLAIFCYGECYDDKLANMAHLLIEEQKVLGDKQMAEGLEDLLICMEGSYM